MMATILDHAHPVIGVLVATSLLVFVGRWVFSVNLRLPFPPGPKGKFLLGNLGQISAEHPEMDYIRWGQEYSTSYP